MEIQITFSEPLNVSLAIGDQVHHTTVALSGGYSLGYNYKYLGDVVKIEGQVVFLKNNITLTPPVINLSGEYFMFTKPNKVNLTNLTGYFAELKFVNNDTKKAELFSVGSEIVESSK
tara:strand:+ start:206 stop:556 length:351 start_codon:yes stop_codon:yes gene_type:complete